MATKTWNDPTVTWSDPTINWNGGIYYGRTFNGTLNFAGSLNKTIKKILNGGLIFTGVLLAIKYVRYKVTAITIKCGTAIVDTLKLRKIQ